MHSPSAQTELSLLNLAGTFSNDPASDNGTMGHKRFCTEKHATSWDVYNSFLPQGFALLSTVVLWLIEKKKKKENASEESERLIHNPGTAVRYDSAMVA